MVRAAAATTVGSTMFAANASGVSRGTWRAKTAIRNCAAAAVLLAVIAETSETAEIVAFAMIAAFDIAVRADGTQTAAAAWPRASGTHTRAVPAFRGNTRCRAPPRRTASA